MTSCLSLVLVAMASSGRASAGFHPEYLRVPLLKNSVWLQVLSSDARYYRETGQIKNLWRGESAIVAPPDALETSAPFLLVPALRFFGKSTPDIATVDVFARDAAWK